MKAERKILLSGFYLLFFLSGAAGLVYQTLWLRMFALVLGNSLHSASVVFASYMCGMALGAWLFGRFIRARKDPLAIYAALEAGIALTALAAGNSIPRLVSLAPFFYRHFSQYPFLLDLSRASLSFLVLLPPTALIGGTLPVLAHFLTRRLEVTGRRIGALYGWNTVGAVAGCVIASFWLLRLEGLNAALYCAAALNLFVALAAGLIRVFAGGLSGVPDRETADRAAAGPSERAAVRRKLLLAAAGITGAAGLACEVAWARFLSYILLNDIYAYYLMLSTLLLGIGAGSLLYSRWLDRLGNKLRLLALLEIFLGFCICLCYLFCSWLYLWPGQPMFKISLQNLFSHFFTAPFLIQISIRFVYTLAAVFPPALIIGAVFPLICRLYITDESSIGAHAGAVYALNTAGAVLGALGAGFFLVPRIGVQSTLFATAAANLALGAVLLRFEPRLRGGRPWLKPALYPALAVLFALIAVLPDNQVRRFAMKDKKHTRLVYYREGLSGTVSVVEDKINRIRTFYINAVAEIHNSFTGMQTFKMLGHLPLLLHAGEPRSVLMVTFGGGIASGAAACHSLERLDVVELEPSVIEASDCFREENRSVVQDPRVQIHLDDGRHFLAMAGGRYDAIISDATNPASPDSWLLYTAEFYALCRDRLARGGIMAQWLPFHTGSPRTYSTVVKTFQSVFPHTSIWLVKDYTILIGTAGPLRISYPGLAARLAEKRLRSDLEPYCLDDPLELLDCFLMGEQGARNLTAVAEISTDNLPLYQLETTQPADQGSILELLERNRERVFPLLEGIEAEKAVALKDTLEQYFLSAGYLLRRDYPAAGEAAPFSCKYSKYLEEDRELVPYTRSLIQYDPDNYSLLLRSSVILAGHREFSEARALMQRLIELDPADPSNYVNSGNLDFELGDYGKSVENYRKALKMGRRDSELLSRLGRSSLAAGDIPGAAESFSEAVELEPENESGWFNLGVAFSRLDSLERAAECFRKVLDLDPENAGALINLGFLQIKQEKFEPAQALFRRAVRLAPLSAQAWLGLGTSLYRLDRPAEAREAFQQALKIRPADQVAAQYLKLLEARSVNR